MLETLVNLARPPALVARTCVLVNVEGIEGEKRLGSSFENFGVKARQLGDPHEVVPSQPLVSIGVLKTVCVE